MEAIASRLEATALRMEAIASIRLEAIASRLGAIASRLGSSPLYLHSFVQMLDAKGRLVVLVTCVCRISRTQNSLLPSQSRCIGHHLCTAIGEFLGSFV